MCLMTAGVFSTLQPRTQQPARAQPSFPAQASKLRALPKLLLLPPPSSVRRLRSSSFFTRNEKRRDRDARAVLFQIYSLRLTRRRVWLQASG